MARSRLPKPPRNGRGSWPAFFRSLRNHQEQAMAEGQFRPAPGAYQEQLDQQPDQTKDDDRD